MGPAFRGPEGEALRREWLAERATMVRHALSDASLRLEPADFERLVSISTLLCTSQTPGVLNEYLGLPAAESAEAVAWAIFKLSEEAGR